MNSVAKVASKIVFSESTKRDLREISRRHEEFDIYVPKMRDLDFSHIIIAREKKTKELLGFCQLIPQRSGRLKIYRLAIVNGKTGMKIGRKLLGYSINYGLKKGHTSFKAYADVTQGAINFWANKAKFENVPSKTKTKLPRFEREFEPRKQELVRAIIARRKAAPKQVLAPQNRMRVDSMLKRRANLIRRK